MLCLLRRVETYISTLSPTTIEQLSVCNAPVRLQQYTTCDFLLESKILQFPIDPSTKRPFPGFQRQLVNESVLRKSIRKFALVSAQIGFKLASISALQLFLTRMRRTDERSYEQFAIKFYSSRISTIGDKRTK